MPQFFKHILKTFIIFFFSGNEATLPDHLNPRVDTGRFISAVMKTKGKRYSDES